MNAKQELQEILKDKAKIKCAKIYKIDCYSNEDEKLAFKLLLNYTDTDLVNFYNSLDFEHNDSYGGQELFGIVWLMDNSWLSRSEYDSGSEWWKHNVLPIIPTDLLNVDDLHKK